MDIGDNAQMTRSLSSSLLLSNKSVADKMPREHLQVKYKNSMEIKIYRVGISYVEGSPSRKATGTQSHPRLYSVLLAPLSAHFSVSHSWALCIFSFSLEPWGSLYCDREPVITMCMHASVLSHFVMSDYM